MEQPDKAEEAYSEGLRLDPNNQDAKAALNKLQQDQRMWILVIYLSSAAVKLLQLRSNLVVFISKSRRELDDPFQITFTFNIWFINLKTLTAFRT